MVKKNDGKIEDEPKEVSAILTERVTSDLNKKNLEHKRVPIFFGIPSRVDAARNNS